MFDFREIVVMSALSQKWKNTLLLIFGRIYKSLEPLSEKGGDSNLEMRRVRGARRDQLLPRAAAALQAGAQRSRRRIPLPTLQQDHHLNKQVRIPYRTSDIPVPYKSHALREIFVNGPHITYMPPHARFPSLSFLPFVQYVLFPLVPKNFPFDLSVSLDIDLVLGHSND